IISKEFILVDEISKSYCRWKYLREEEAFEKIILEQKNRELSRNEKTFTNSETDTLTEDLSKEILNFGGKSILSNVTEHLKEDEASRIANQKATTSTSLSEEPVANYATERELQQKVAGKNLLIRFSIFLIIMTAFGSLFLMS